MKSFLKHGSRFILLLTLSCLFLCTNTLPAPAAPTESFSLEDISDTQIESGNNGDDATSFRPKLPTPGPGQDRWGEITIAPPKVWQYERVNALLDGLLRDVEGVSMADLVQLDPNKQNAAAIRFVQSALGVAVTYDQAAQVNNSNVLQNWQVQHDAQVQQLRSYTDYTQGLMTQRDRLTQELFAANNTVLTLQAAKDPSDDQKKQLAAAQDRATTLNTQLTQVNQMISSAGSAPALAAPPTPSGTSAQAPPATLSSFADVLKSLPDGVQKGITSALQSPNYPATKQLDNFITLLHERLAREISVLQSDLMRDPEQVPFLLQFDVGLYPSDKTKNHMARVEFDLNGCKGCKVYSIYPGQSSYNVANYQGASKRRSFVGNFMSLIGLGISASYQRQEDTLQGSLVQSVYISGFQDDNNDDESIDSPRNVKNEQNSATEEKQHAAARREAHAHSKDKKIEEAHGQRFGWHYNSAPFDQYVTPGIRTTFAIITVPKSLITHRASTPALQLGSDKATKIAHSTQGGDIPRLDIGAQKDGQIVAIVMGSEPQNAPTKEGQQTDLKVRCRSAQAFSLDFNVISDWSKRDNPLYQKSHWYVPKTYLNDDHSMYSRKLRVELPGTRDPIELPREVRDDPQRLHVMRMEYNTVPSPSPTPVAGTTSAVAVSAPPAGSGNPTYGQSNGCTRKECATLLLSLDVPIDPNLVITASGTPLRRVRDWRGRATSVLPPVQSLSDLAPQPSGTIGPKVQNIASRSLLETDQLEPNSWFAVTSHDLLLILSHDLVGEEAFPVIQISDPGKRPLVIPYDLRQNYTEIIFDGFRLLPSGQNAVARYVSRNFGGNLAGAYEETGAGQGGPYPYSTFMPLFLPDPPTKRFYAFVGQTGEDLIIGFLGGHDAANGGKVASFAETRTTVILEDQDIDLAWSLSCTRQGDELVCKLPVEAIRRSYVDIIKACQEKNDCPSIESSIAHVRKAVLDAAAQVPVPAADQCSKETDVLSTKKTGAIASLLSGKAFVSRLQVWIAQADPNGENAFWSPEPAKVGLFPLSADFTQGDTTFKPWHFYAPRTTGATFAIEACNYLNAAATIRYLTPLDFPLGRGGWESLQDDKKVNGCSYVNVPTLALKRPEVVLEVKNNDETRTWTSAIATSRLAPALGEPRISRNYDKSASISGKLIVTNWEIDIPVLRAHCQDSIDFPSELSSVLIFEWRDGPNHINPSTYRLRNGECTANWWDAQSNGQIQLHFEVSKHAAPLLPADLHLLRTDDNGVKVPVAKLPNLRKLILPSRLKVESMGGNLFALRGPNANAIDAVAVNNGDFAHTYPAGAGLDFALVIATFKKTVPVPDATAGVKGNSGNQDGSSSQNSASRNKDGGQTPSPTPAPSASLNPSVSPTPSSAGATTPSSSASRAGKPSKPAPKPKPKTKEIDVNLDPGTYALVPLIRDGKNYIPLEVTDDQGKALTLTKTKEKPTDDGNKSQPDETITITKSTKKAVPDTKSGGGQPAEAKK